jgi:hypothetical protein
MTGAKPAGRLDLDHDLAWLTIPRRRDHDPAYLDGWQIGLGAAGPVLVRDLHRLEPHVRRLGQRLNGRRCGITPRVVGKVRHPRVRDAEVVLVNGEQIVFGEQRHQTVA